MNHFTGWWASFIRQLLRMFLSYLRTMSHSLPFVDFGNFFVYCLIYPSSVPEKDLLHIVQRAYKTLIYSASMITWIYDLLLASITINSVPLTLKFESLFLTSYLFLPWSFWQQTSSHPSSSVFHWPSKAKCLLAFPKILLN